MTEPAPAALPPRHYAVFLTNRHTIPMNPNSFRGGRGGADVGSAGMQSKQDGRWGLAAAVMAEERR